MKTSTFHLRKRDSYLFSFLIPVTAMLFIFIVRGIFPFGSETFLRTDMYHQYAPFFSEFHHKLHHGGSLLYSWDIGLGVNFTSLYAYYLASPVNWLILLCPKGLILEFMTYMIVIKIGLSGITMNYYLRKHFETTEVSSTLFAILYALSGYISAYSWNLMWLDCIILFPLIMLGFERLMKGGSGALYVVTLGVSILSNYYISIMICIFLVIMFIAENVLLSVKSWKELLIRGVRFTIYSLLAGGLAAVTLIPEICTLQSTASGEMNFPQVLTQYFTIIDMFARQMPFVETEQGLDHWPNIYAGVLIFLMLPLYFMNRRIVVCEKVVKSVLLVFFYLSFSVNILNFIWHGFHYPNSLPCRQSFIYIFLLLLMSFEAYLKRRESSLRELGIALFVTIGFLLIAQKTVTDDAIHFSVFYITGGIAALYYAYLYCERKRIGSREMLSLAMLVTVAAESGLNMGVTSVTTTSRTAYTADNDDVRKLVADIQERDPGFYRFEKMTRKTKDDGAWMNFPSVSLFSSMADAHCSDFFRDLGMEASTNAYSITGSTPLMNMLFSVNYDIYSQQPEAAEKRKLTEVSVSGNTWLYEAGYTLPLGYVVPKEALDNWNVGSGTPAHVQNQLCEVMGTSPVLETVLGSINGTDYTFTAVDSGEYYAYVSNSSVKEATVKYSFTESSFKNLDRGFFIEIGYLDAGQTVTIHSDTNGQEMDADVYRFNYDALGELYQVLSKETFDPSVHTDTKLKGDVTTKDGGILMISIPYEKGWTVLVDGEKADTKAVKDTFLGVMLTPGTHTIEMRYFPDGLKAGVIITIVSLILLLLIFFFIQRYGSLAEELSEGLKDEPEWLDEPEKPVILPGLENLRADSHEKIFEYFEQEERT